MNLAASKRQLSRGRKIFFACAVLVIGFLFLEVVTRLTVPTFMGTLYTIEVFKAQQTTTAQSGRGEGTAREVLNPYFGWTLDPDIDPGIDVESRHFEVNQYGFVDNQSPITHRQPGHTTIAILGGSFAAEFGLQSGDHLLKLLKSHPQFNGQKLTLIRLGMAGFKQPQQLMVLNYVLALGAEYDYVVNLDGFNEGVLPATDNYLMGLSVAHPRGWNARLQDVVDPRVTSVSYQINELRAKRQMLAKQIENSWLKGLYLRQLVWKLRDESLKRSLIEFGTELQSHNLSEGRQFAVAGPINAFANNTELYNSLGDLWRNCSRQMHLLCHGEGMHYMHFLQPNQYLPNSKVLTPHEREFAFANDGHEYKLAVEGSYPVLQERGKELLSMGVNFEDLTQIYLNDDRTIYRDWCCHVNKQGYDVIAAAIAEKLLSTLPE